MVLPKVFKSKKQIDKLYISVIVSDSSIQAALWQANENGVSLLQKSKKRIYQDQDQAVVESDKALQELGKQSEEVNEVIFGLQPTWVDDKGVASLKKPLLKSITEELDLKAIGFVITSEALSRQLSVDNPRLSALLVEFSQHELYLSLISQGKLIGTKFVGRSDQTIADMTEALARLNAHSEEEIKFPSKMFLNSIELNQEELTQEQQSLLKQDWVNSHPFAHPPTVEILNPDLTLEAIVKQGGVSVAGVKIVPKQTNVKKPEKTLVDDNVKETAVEETELTKDAILKTQATSFGLKVKTPSLPQAKKIFPKKEINQEELHKNKIDKIESGIKMKISDWFSHHKTFAIGGFFAGLLALGVIGWYWLNSNVLFKVTMDLETRTISQEATVTLDPNISDSSVEKLILAASTVENQVSGSETKESTGAKLVGDQAGGKVTIYNTTNGEKTFAKGIKLFKGDLEFTLNDEVKVASASVKTGSTDHGKKEVNVTASQIGSDSNLSKETELQVAKFDTGTYYAIVTDTLAGGSSREVRVVSAADYDLLLEDLTSELVSKANQAMQDDVNDGNYLVETDAFQVDKKIYTAEVGDEVSSVTLDLELIVSALSYNTENLKPLAQEVLKAEIPEGYTLANSEPQIMSAPDQEATKSGAVTLAVNITSQAQPDLSFDDLIQEIVGKRIDEAKQTLTSNDKVNSVELEIVPKFATRLYRRIPKDPAKIEIQ